jgi:hypothetical protein
MNARYTLAVILSLLFVQSEILFQIDQRNIIREVLVVVLWVADDGLNLRKLDKWTRNMYSTILDLRHTVK